MYSIYVSRSYTSASSDDVFMLPMPCSFLLVVASCPHSGLQRNYCTFEIHCACTIYVYICFVQNVVIFNVTVLFCVLWLTWLVTHIRGVFLLCLWARKDCHIWSLHPSRYVFYNMFDLLLSKELQSGYLVLKFLFIA